MPVTADEAATLLADIQAGLKRIGAHAVLADLEQSIRLGIEEKASEPPPEPTEPRSRRRQREAELSKVGDTLRRRPTPIEALEIAIEILEQRLIVVPAIAKSIQKNLGGTGVLWRSDQEAAHLPEREQPFAADITDLIPVETNEVINSFRLLIDELPGRTRRSPEAGEGSSGTIVTEKPKPPKGE